MLAQRKGNRQFEEIGDKISESLRPFLESEGIRLDEGECTAVALAVAETINKSKLSAGLLAERNLQPKQLAQYMLTSNADLTRNFSAAGAALYERLINESATYVVDIATRFPTFTRDTFEVVLRREDQIIAKADQILSDLQRMREELNPMIEAERFEIEYRQSVARNLDVLQLIGVDVSLLNRRHRLSVAYITLSVEQKISTPATKADTSAEEVREDLGDTIIPVDSALASSRRLLIRGLAGSGKTTLLQWIAVKAATKSFDGRLSEWNDAIPFYIRLRHYAHSKLPGPEAFLDFAAPIIAGTMPERWIHTILGSGRAIILIDGVDEVSASQREEVHTWLRDLVETYNKAVFIVTSRPCHRRWMNHEEFREAELQPLGLADIYSFIDHWHNAVREELQENLEKAQLEPLAEYLKEQVKSNRTLCTLATSPLLCAMLCALNRERRYHLPHNLIELYHACCVLLLERRDKERRVDLSGYPALNNSQMFRLLEDLAYSMLKETRSEIAVPLVDERFARKLANMPNIPPDASGDRTRRLFVERADIIREPVAGYIVFTHRTFQEFFAAKVACDATNVDELLANALDDQWREVIVLACGLASKEISEKIIMALINRGDQEIEKGRRYQLHLLAVSCMETAIETEPGVKEEVNKRLSRLGPPTDMADARALAAAGELAVKHLAKKRRLSPASTAACVRTLTTIGGEAALDVLEGYTNDAHKLVVKELLRGWDSFDRETYARRVLSPAWRNNKELRLVRPTSLEGLQHLTNISYLILYECPQVKDLSPLASLTQLSHLFLSHCSQVSDLSPLANLIQLSELGLYDCPQVSDLSPLANLTRLLVIQLYHCSRLTDLSPLARLDSLKKLCLVHPVNLQLFIPQSMKEKVTIIVESASSRRYG